MQNEILLVDDDLKVLEILGESLHRRGYTVSTASNGRQAIQSYETGDPAAVVLDMMLPDMNGVEVARLILSRAFGVKGIVILTPYQDGQFVAGILSAATNNYRLVKTNINGLVGIVRTVVEGDAALVPA